MARRVPLLVWLALLPACSDGGCGDVLAPLAGAIPSGAFFNDAATVRVSSAGVSYIEENIPEIAGAFASSSCVDVPCPNGWGACDAENVCRSTDPSTAFIGVKIPATTVQDPGAYFEELRVCTSHRSPTFDDCNVYVDVTGVDLQPQTNNTLGVTADVTIWSSTIKMHLYGAGLIEPDFNCDILVRNANNQNQPIYKTIGASLTFDASNPLGRLELNPQPISVDLVENDVVLCGILEWDVVKGLIFGFIEDAVKDQLQGAVDDLLTGLLRESCAEGPCSRPDVSFCNGDDMCQFTSGGELVPRLLGLEGTLALDALLGGFAGEAAAVDFSAAANTAATPNGGLTLGMRAATNAPSSTCVPSFAAPSPTLPAFSPSGSGWHLAVGASDKLLNRLVFDAFDSGALCQTLEPGSISALSSGALSLLVPSLDEVTGGSVPLALDILPRTPPRIEIGRNLTGPDPDEPSTTILIEPLMNLVLEDLDLDVYAQVDGALLRVLTLSVDLNIDLSLAVGGAGELVLVAGDASSWVVGVDVLHSDVLRESPADIEDAIPTLLGLVLPMLTESLAQSFTVPSFNGFALDVGTIGGSQVIGTTTTGDFNRYAHLAIDATLTFDPAAAQVARVETDAKLASLEVPLAAALQAGERVRVVVDASIAGRDAVTPVLWSRVDGGMWRPPHDGRTLVVTDPVLHREGEHVIEIAAALPGEPGSLDDTPVELRFVVDAYAPTLALTPGPDGVAVHAADTLAAPASLVAVATVDGAGWGRVFLDDEGRALLAVDAARHEVQVTVTDPSGRATTARVGQVVAAPGVDGAGPDARAADPSRRDDTLAPDPAASSSCAATGPLTSPLVLALMLALRRRRRTPLR